MTEPASIMAVLAAIALLTMLIGWWRAENRADRIEADRDTAIKQRDAATAAANKHWRALRRAQGELTRYRRNLSEADHWATVPREPTTDEIADLKARFKLAVEQPTAVLDSRTLTPIADMPTAVLPATPVPYWWKGGR